MPEYFDHLMRSEASYGRAIEYVLQNPAKAGLNDWKWVQRGNQQEANPRPT